MDGSGDRSDPQKLVTTQPGNTTATTINSADSDPRGGVMELQVLRTIPEIEQAASQWEAFLRENADEHNHQQHPRSVVRELRNNPKTFRALIMIVRECGHIVAVVPWHIHSMDFELKAGVRTLLRAPIKMCKLFGANMAVAKGADCSQVLDFILNQLFVLRKEYSAIGIFDRPTDGELFQFLEKLPKIDKRFKTIAARHDALPQLYLDLPATHDEWFSGLSSKTRATLRRAERMLNKRADSSVKFVNITRPDQVAGFFSDVRRIYANSWQGRSMGGDRGSKEQIAYCEEMARHGWLRCHILYADDVPLSYSIGFQYQGTFFGHDMAFDPSWQKYSPGNVMFWYLVRDLYAHDTPSKIDFGSGTTEFKRRFSNRSGHCQTIYIAPQGSNYSINLMRAQRSLLDATTSMRVLLAKAGIDRWVRRIVKKKGGAVSTATKSIPKQESGTA